MLKLQLHSNKKCYFKYDLSLCKKKNKTNENVFMSFNSLNIIKI